MKSIGPWSTDLAPRFLGRRARKAQKPVSARERIYEAQGQRCARCRAPHRLRSLELRRESGRAPMLYCARCLAEKARRFMPRAILRKKKSREQAETLASTPSSTEDTPGLLRGADEGKRMGHPTVKWAAGAGASPLS